VLGAEHPATLDTLADLAQVLVAQGKFAAAEPPAREAASGDEKIRPDAWQRFFAESVLGASLLAALALCPVATVAALRISAE